jgi:acetyl-CoA carboxylase/biotin carboxylase 1
VRQQKIQVLMERLDEDYAKFKRDSKDTSLTPEARAKAAENLGAREADLTPTYKQIALLYADLHE